MTVRIPFSAVPSKITHLIEVRTKKKKEELTGLTSLCINPRSCTSRRQRRIWRASIRVVNKDKLSVVVYEDGEFSPTAPLPDNLPSCFTHSNSVGAYLQPCKGERCFWKQIQASQSFQSSARLTSRSTLSNLAILLGRAVNLSFQRKRVKSCAYHNHLSQASFSQWTFRQWCYQWKRHRSQVFVEAVVCCIVEHCHNPFVGFLKKN